MCLTHINRAMWSGEGELMAKRRVSDMLQRLAVAEANFLSQDFLAPVVTDGTVRVRMAGVVCQLTIEPADFRGWGVFRRLPRPHAHSGRAPKLEMCRQPLMGFSFGRTAQLPSRTSPAPQAESISRSTGMGRGSKGRRLLSRDPASR